MKTIRPRIATSTEPDYPALGEEPPDESRRSFLRVATHSALATTGGLLLGAATARARSRRKPRSVTLRWKRRYTFRYGNYQLQKAVAQTHDVRLARFLGARKHALGIETALRRVLDGHSCADLLDGKRLTRLQRALGVALAAHYRQRTHRRSKPPTVVLFVGVPQTACLGSCPSPVPVCRPPRP